MTGGIPSSWGDTTTPPWPYGPHTWARMPWPARARALARLRPPTPGPHDPEWRAPALRARVDVLDRVAPAGTGHVRHPRAHRRTTVHNSSPGTPAGHATPAA